MILWPKALPLMSLVVLAQVAIFDVALLAGEVRLDLPLYLVVAIGLVARSRHAILACFVLGLIVDLFQFGPFGLHGLMYCLAAWTLAEARLRVLQGGASLRTVQGMMATWAVTGLSWLLGGVFGQEPFALNHGPLGVVLNLLIVGVCGGIAVHPMTRVAHGLYEEPLGGRDVPLVGL